MQSEFTPRGIPPATFQALVNEHPDAEARIRRGVELVDHVEATRTPGLYLVRSATNEKQAYQVDGFSCSCPDRQTRSSFCKHLAAVALYLAREILITVEPEDEGIPYELTEAAYELLAQPCVMPALCPNCQAEPALLNRVDQWGTNCIMVELYGPEDAA
jgi:hypothetical protein